MGNPTYALALLGMMTRPDPVARQIAWLRQDIAEYECRIRRYRQKLKTAEYESLRAQLARYIADDTASRRRCRAKLKKLIASR